MTQIDTIREKLTRGDCPSVDDIRILIDLYDRKVEELRQVESELKEWIESSSHSDLG